MNETPKHDPEIVAAIIAANRGSDLMPVVMRARVIDLHVAAERLIADLVVTTVVGEEKEQLKARINTLHSLIDQIGEKLGVIDTDDDLES